MFVRNKTRRYSLRYIAEQSPSFTSRISLSHERDALGLPRVIVEKSVSDIDVTSVLKAHNLLDQELRRLKLGRLEYLAAPADRSAIVAAQGAGGYHQIGLARMGDGPRFSVVDANCCMHAVSNLHVAGSATFSTSSQANPTFLIVCLSLRLAKRLIADLKRS
jgi:choline dehydrogenase-like flavoprotein